MLFSQKYNRRKKLPFNVQDWDWSQQHVAPCCDQVSKNQKPFPQMLVKEGTKEPLRTFHYQRIQYITDGHKSGY